MISVSKKLGAALLVLMLATPAYAQVCKEPGGSTSGKVNMDCDMTYRNSVIACDKEKAKDVIGTRPSCPPKPMPMIDTPKKSYITDYTPYLWNFPRDAEDSSRPYAGTYALGTPGDTSRTFQIFGNTAPGTKRLAACTAQVRVPSDPSTNGEWARLTRLQVDNCSNQFILNASIYPFQKEATKLLSMDDPSKPGAVLNLEGECQPLKTFEKDDEEYVASKYLEAAWKKLLQDPEYRMTTPAAAKCIPCLKDGIPCDREPHLPCKSTIDNPLKPPSPFPEVKLNSIASVKYEEINDPSHPFSPRWDYLLADRDYANWNLAALSIMSPKAALINGFLDVYMTDKKNSVFCAGVRESKETDAKKKKNDEVHVDVLGFRRDMFDDALTKRTLYNSACFGPGLPGKATVPVPTKIPLLTLPAFMSGSWCFKIYSINVFTMTALVQNEDCWKCYSLNGKVDDSGPGQHPPCTTHYLGKDLSMNNPLFTRPGGLNMFSKKAQCGTAMDKICKDLRKPYTSINKLKMRYHRTDDDDDKDGDNNVLKEGALEGMTFGEYFGNHMPYPRMWDMGGVALHKTPAPDRNYQDPNDTTGQYVAIVGIGREAASKAASDAAGADADGKKPEDKYKDQRCKAQGWGPAIIGVNFGGVSLTVPDPVTSWTEMKLYQTRALNSVGMSCIPRYEKVFKPGSAENMVLAITGGEWQRLLITKCDRDKNGLSKNCVPMTYKEYVAAGSPENSKTVIYMKQLDVQAIPQPWRGYMAAEDSKNKFPEWGNGSPVIKTGLDNATRGDIILMPNGPKDESTKGAQGLAKVSFVIETRLPDKTDCDAKKNCYVRVLEPDNGKWPDSCGTTDTWGEMKTRYYYKPGNLPDEAQKEFDRIKSTGDCVETKISHCEMSAWSKLKVYRIREDKRKGCQNKDKAVNCEKDE